MNWDDHYTPEELKLRAELETAQAEIELFKRARDKREKECEHKSVHHVGGAAPFQCDICHMKLKIKWEPA